MAKILFRKLFQESTEETKVRYLASGSTKVMLKSGDDCLLLLESKVKALQLNRVAIQSQESEELVLLAIGPEFWVLIFLKLDSLP